MTDDAEELHAYLDDFETLIVDEADWADRNRILFERPTDEQIRWRSMQGRRVIWRAANSLGKSRAQAADFIDCARGTNRYRYVKPPPISILIVSYSFEQMDPLLEKLWELLPKDEIDPACYYVPGQGIKGYKVPVIPFIAGPGRGSAIYFATYKQGAKRIMGGQYDIVGLDEPPPYEVWGEVQPRLNAKKGVLRVSFTPTPESPDLEYLRGEVEKGAESKGKRGVVEMQTSITEHAVTPRGSQFVELPWMNQAEIDHAIDTYLEDERDMREHGAWYPLAKGRWVSTFTDENVSSIRPPEGAFLVVSLDHGAQAGKQAASLQAYTNREDIRATRCYWMAEAIGDGRTSSEDDAQAILDMLESEGLTYDNVDLWVGDRSLDTYQRHKAKSNERLRKAFADRLGRDYHQTKHIFVPNKFDGSVRLGAQLLRGLFKRRLADGLPAGLVAPRCVKTREALLKFSGRKDDPCKDMFDSLRYGCEAACEGRQQIDIRFMF